MVNETAKIYRGSKGCLYLLCESDDSKLAMQVH